MPMPSLSVLTEDLPALDELYNLDVVLKACDGSRMMSRRLTIWLIDMAEEKEFVGAGIKAILDKMEEQV
jgi:hypothetical protein